MASIHLPALASKHIGSGPGVVGASGMHVQPLLPLRMTVMLPLASAVTIDALCASDAGAADSALATGSFDVFVSLIEVLDAILPAGAPPLLQPTKATAAAPAVSSTKAFNDVIVPSFHPE